MPPNITETTIPEITQQEIDLPPGKEGLSPDEAAAALAFATNLSEQMMPQMSQEMMSETPQEEFQEMPKPTEELGTEEVSKTEPEGEETENGGEDKLTALEEQINEIRTSLEKMHKSHEAEMKKITQGIKELLNESE